MDSKVKMIAILVIIFFGILISTSLFYIVPPGFRGVAVTMGTVDQMVKPEGLGFKLPWTTITPVQIKQDTKEHRTMCFSKDQQELNFHIKVLYKLNDSSVIKLFQNFAGDPFFALVLPRVEESLKEQTVMQDATTILAQRELVKSRALEAARKKVGEMLTIVDLVIVDVDFSPQLKQAIESKMIAAQQAQQAEYSKQQAKVEAETALIKAQGEANAISVHGKALRENPNVLQLEVVRKWNGVSPLVVGENKGNFILPIKQDMNFKK